MTERIKPPWWYEKARERSRNVKITTDKVTTAIRKQSMSRAEESIRKNLEVLILITPTSPRRELLTVVNILFLIAMAKDSRAVKEILEELGR